MNKIRSFSASQPLFVALAVLVIAAVYFVAPILFADTSELFGHGRQQQGASEFADGLWTEAAMASVIVGAVFLIGWGRETGLLSMPRWRATLFTLPYIAFVLALIFVTYGAALLENDDFALTPAQWGTVGVASFAALIVGFFEELLFRGVLLHGLRSKLPAIAAVLVAAVIFGLFHFVNWMGGQPLEITLFQVSGAIGGGVFLGALVLWTGSLWPSIIMHGLWDAAVTLDQTITIANGGEVASEETALVGAESAYDPLLALVLSPETIYGLILLALWAWWNKRRSAV